MGPLGWILTGAVAGGASGKSWPPEWRVELPAERLLGEGRCRQSEDCRKRRGKQCVVESHAGLRVNHGAWGCIPRQIDLVSYSHETNPDCKLSAGARLVLTCALCSFLYVGTALAQRRQDPSRGR